MREYEKQGLSKNEYLNIHAYLQYHFTKTGICIKCGNKPKRTEWALKPGCTYSKDINRYEELCTSCHIRQDFSEERRVKVSDRMRDGYLTGKYKSYLPLNPSETNPTNKPVFQLDKNTLEVLNEYRSLTQAAEQFGGKAGVISNQVLGRKKTAYGYKWKFKHN